MHGGGGIMEECGCKFCMLLRDKTALITGAARGVCRATALLMAGEGADVGVIDILPDVEVTAGLLVAVSGKMMQGGKRCLCRNV
jgi:NAD(P)-dependent dehydrogenase (short-subunit alcohol dehydrogenase family)